MLGLRGGMSIYAGWLTAATILGMANALKFLGMSELNGYDEEMWTVAMLWTALVVFSLTAILNDDFIYGAVFIWAGLGAHSASKALKLKRVWWNTKRSTNSPSFVICVDSQRRPNQASSNTRSQSMCPILFLVPTVANTLQTSPS